MVNNGGNRRKQIYKIKFSYLDYALLETNKKLNFEIDWMYKNQSWTLIQKSNEKENEKTGASC